MRYAKEGVIVPLKTFLRENPVSEGKPLFWSHKKRKFLKIVWLSTTHNKCHYVKCHSVWLKGEIEA